MNRIKLDAITPVLFIFFIALSLVGIEPFPAQDAASYVLRMEGGDFLRQASYISIFFVLIGTSILKNNGRIIVPIPHYYVAVCLLIFISAVWSLSEGLTLKRSIFTIVVIYSVFTFSVLIKVEDAVNLIRTFFYAIIIVNILSVIFISTAIHSADDFRMTYANIGAWRGLHFEKNIAGMVAAMITLFMVRDSLDRRGLHSHIFSILSLAFLLGTQSKTSIALCIICIMLLIIYRATSKSTFGVNARSTLFFVLVISFLFVYLLSYQLVVDYLQDPTVFTGRGYIWNVVIEAIKDRPLLGYGYRGFWLAEDSPVFILANESWVHEVSHAHNGYVEVLIGLGFFGLGLTLYGIGFIIFSAVRQVSYCSDLWFSWIIFFLCLNMTEVEIFERDRPAWVLFLIAVAYTYVSRARKAI